MNVFKILLAAGFAATGAAQAQSMGPYLGVHLGTGSVTEDGVSISDPSFGTLEGNVEYDAGAVFGVLFGYQFGEFMAGEMEVTGQSNNSEFFLGEDSYSVTAYFGNLVLTTPPTERIIGWVGAGAGFASTNIENAGAPMAYQAKAGIDFRLAPGHFVGLQGAMLQTGGFEGEQDGTDFSVDYGTSSVSLTYRFRFPGY